MTGTAASRLAPRVSIVAVVVFVVTMGTSMALYPGGSFCTRDANAHDFLRNFFCDLLHDVALNGRPNGVGAVLAQVAMLVLCVGLLAAFWTLPRLVESRLAGMIVRVLGTLCVLGCVAVALTPSNHHPTLHTIAVLSAALPGLSAMLVATLALGASPATRALAITAAGALVAGAIDAWLYARQLTVPDDCGIALPALQKVAAAFFLVWIAWVGAHRLRELRAAATP